MDIYGFSDVIVQMLSILSYTDGYLEEILEEILLDTYSPILLGWRCQGHAKKKKWKGWWEKSNQWRFSKLTRDFLMLIIIKMFRFDFHYNSTFMGPLTNQMHLIYTINQSHAFNIPD